MGYGKVARRVRDPAEKQVAHKERTVFTFVIQYKLDGSCWFWFRWLIVFLGAVKSG